MKAEEVVEDLPVDGEAEEDLTAGEKFLMASKPYWAHIALGVLSVILATVLWTSWSDLSTDTASMPWRDLNNAMTQAGLTNDVSSLKEMAANYEGEAASHWALLMAGDSEVNRGISMLARDRVGGLKLIEKGAESIEKVVQASPASKSPMLQRRSTFMLAQANEALGKFDVAKGHYQELVDSAPDSPFASASRRGVARCSNPDLVAVYDKFRSWEEAAEEAPGPLVPDAPKMNIDEIKLPEGEPDTFDAGGGDFGGDKMKEEGSEEAEKPAEAPKAEEAKPEAEKASEKTEPEAEKPAEKEAEKKSDESAEKKSDESAEKKSEDEGSDG